MTQDELKTILDYNPETGEFKRRSNGRVIGFKHNCRTAKDKAIGKKDKFYIKLELNGKRHYAHKLAILYMFGTMPVKGQEIDHIDGDGTNNRINNLRVVSRAENCWYNRRKQRGEYPLGVSKTKTGFEARLVVNKKTYRKTFKTIKEAEMHRKYLEQKHGW